MSGNVPGGGFGSRAGALLSNRYQLDERIGAGGMGEVWRATDTLLSRLVAVKMLHTAQMGEPISRQRFRTEAQITAALSHAGIAQVYDYGEQDDIAFLVMELISGEPLSAIIKRNPGLDPDIALDVLDQAAQALAAAHSRGVVHRDIKPGNLLVTENGTVKLTDFGIARGNESVTLTQTGMVMGTAQYISPEQVAGKPATQSSDIYALGVVAYECLAGRPPFMSDTPLALALAHTREPPPPLPETVPAPVRELVERMLNKDPQDRPVSAAEVSQQAQWLRAGLSGAAATESLGLASATGQTMVVGTLAGSNTGPSTMTGGQSGQIPPTGAWPPAGTDGSDRVAGESAPNSRLNLPVVLALIATVGVVALGIVLVSQLWKGTDPSGTPDKTPSVAPSLSQSPDTDVETDPDTPAPEYPGGQDVPPVQNQPEPDYSPSTEPSTTTTQPPTDPSVPSGDTGETGDTGDDADTGGDDGSDDGADAGEQTGEDTGSGESRSFALPD
ncbi:serine/threonine-protein kinase [Actinorugispora endophytica]|uniref:non-specific serine/threonine protein kinase n=1 Tax=Actinorugispora endophytica TaxID=1605990 RepID=A0A4R6UXZ2_9ACTN|nr:serine/threonine-protein kinase [Actinorugispora endophytica]TDQ52319.1 serine/threonine-protein kinase [Actinorugispora endophytica]